MSIVLSPYEKTEYDKEYSSLLISKGSYEEKIALTLAECIAIVADKGNDVTEAEIAVIKNNFESLSLQYDQLISIEQRMNDLANAAKNQGESLLGFDPNNIIQNGEQRMGVKRDTHPI